MAVNKEIRSRNYPGDDVVTVFVYDFNIPDADSVEVRVWDSVAETWTTIAAGQYNITGLGNPAGGTVTYPLAGSPLTPDERIYISRLVPYLQELVIPQTGEFDSKDVEIQLDQGVYQTQQNRDAGLGGIRLPPGEEFETLPPKSSLAGSTLVFDPVTAEPEAGPTVDQISNAQGYAQDAQAALQSFNGIYLGEQATDPVVDNQDPPQPLGGGELYFNSVFAVARIYNGTTSTWADVGGSVVPVVTTFTGDGVTTTFTLNSAPKNKASLSVFVGGANQYRETYELSGNSLTFDTAPGNGIKCEVTALIAVEEGSPSTFRWNEVYNPLMKFNQRGLASYTATGYTLDRWRLGSNAAASNEFTQEKRPEGESTEFWLKWARTVAGDGVSFIEQRNPGIRRTQGKTVTLAFLVKADAPTQLEALFFQNFGTGGSPSPTWVGQEQIVQVGTTEQLVVLIFDIESTTGKTFGTGGNAHYGYQFRRQHDAQNPLTNLYITQVAIVLGNAAADAQVFHDRGDEVEFDRCEEFVEKTYDINDAPGAVVARGVEAGRSITSGSFGRSVKFRKRKRGIPALTVYSFATGAAGFIRDNSAGVDIPSVPVNISETGYTEDATVTAGNKNFWHYLAIWEL